MIRCLESRDHGKSHRVSRKADLTNGQLQHPRHFHGLPAPCAIWICSGCFFKSRLLRPASRSGGSPQVHAGQVGQTSTYWQPGITGSAPSETLQTGRHQNSRCPCVQPKGATYPPPPNGACLMAHMADLKGSCSPQWCLPWRLNQTIHTYHPPVMDSLLQRSSQL